MREENHERQYCVLPPVSKNLCLKTQAFLILQHFCTSECTTATVTFYCVHTKSSHLMKYLYYWVYYCKIYTEKMMNSLQTTLHKPLDHVLSNYQTQCASGRIFKAQGSILEEILKISEQQLRGLISWSSWQLWQFYFIWLKELNKNNWVWPDKITDGYS